MGPYRLLHPMCQANEVLAHRHGVLFTALVTGADQPGRWLELAKAPCKPPYCTGVRPEWYDWVRSLRELSMCCLVCTKPYGGWERLSNLFSQLHYVCVFVLLLQQYTTPVSVSSNWPSPHCPALHKSRTYACLFIAS